MAQDCVLFWLSHPPYGEWVYGGSESGEEVSECGAGGGEQPLDGDGEEDEGEWDAQDGVHDREQLPGVGQGRHVSVACLLKDNLQLRNCIDQRPYRIAASNTYFPFSINI